MAEEAELLIERRVEAGDPAYATAYAILRLRDEVKHVATALRWIGMDGPANSMGALEFIGLQMKRIADDTQDRRA